MATTSVSAGQVMDRVANLLNDPKKTDYTYDVILPYLNMAIDELSEALVETNSSPSLAITAIVVPAGENGVWQTESTQVETARYPPDLVEIQEIWERPWDGVNPAGSTKNMNSYNRMTRVEMQPIFTATNTLGLWYWEDQAIKFNAYGATIPIDLKIQYLRQGVPYVANANSPIYIIHSRSYLSFKTAALCALFIGENESRAQVLEDQANKAIERTINISSKGKQEIMTRHRPFRSSYKMKGGF
jgi:hypothetical protein